MDLNKVLFHPWTYSESEHGGFDIKLHPEFLLDEEIIVANARNEAIAKQIVEFQNQRWGS